MIATDVEKLEQIISEVLMDEFEAQGHKMTGAVVRDMEYKVTQTADTLIIEGLMYPYAQYLAKGTKPGSIPFSGTGKRGGTSLYIEALKNYAKQRMGITEEKKALGVAFAIAYTQKREGMPTSGSYRFSGTGKRTDWIEEALRKNADRINEAISAMAFNSLQVNIDVMINKWNYELNN